MDYYEVLGVDKKADKAAIDSAYRQKARLHHPDLNPDNPKSAEQFKEVAAAYEVLNNPEKRARYDGGGSFERTVGGAPFNIDPSDIFRQAFGVFRQGRDRGRDARSSIVLTFEEAALGCKKELTLKIEERCDKCERGFKTWEPCMACNGTGEVIINANPWKLASTCSACHGGGKIPKEKCDVCHGRGIGKIVEEVIPFDIPAGIEEGYQIRIQGKGQPGITGQRGTLFVDLQILQHSHFTRQGIDISCVVPVTYTQLVLGDTIVVPTLNGQTKVTIPPGTQPTRKLRLRGLGCADVRGTGKIGDLYVHLDLDVPKNIDDGYKNTIGNLKELENRHLSDRIRSFREKLNG